MNDARKLIAGALLVGGSLLTGNATVLAVAGGIGVNWTSEGLAGLWERAALSLAPGAPLAHAYERALRRAVAQLRDDYRREAGRQPSSAFDLVEACAGAVGRAEFPPGRLSVDAAQRQLAEGLDGLLYGHDPGEAGFLKKRLLDAVALALRDELAHDGEAWRRFHGWLIETLAQNVGSLGGQLARLEEVVGQLRDAPGSLCALMSATERIEGATTRIDERTQRIERKLDEASERGAVSAGGPVFHNEGMTVGRNTYQSGGNMTINAPGVPSGGAESHVLSLGQSSVDVDKVRFRDWLVAHFNLSELEGLCFDVQAALARDGHAYPVSLDHIGGDTLPLRCQNLIEYLDQRGVLRYLIEAARRKQPNAPWPL